MQFYNNIYELVGSTPLLKLDTNIFAKLEYFNPTGSIKDRAALYMIEDAKAKGEIKPGDVLIEPTSGNTGIGLAAIGVAKGYKVIITMPDTMSAERIKTMRAYGAEVVLTDGVLGMQGAIDKADELAATLGGKIMGQFTNPANTKAHFETTGPEIWEATDGRVDIFVAAVGTGGTISGTATYLKLQNAGVKVYGVEPQASAVLSGGIKGAHKIQGIGAGFVPEILDRSVIDEILTVNDDEAYAAGRELAKKYGLLVGISSGAAYAAAKRIASDPQNSGKKIVVIFPDSGSRYLSTEGYY